MAAFTGSLIITGIRLPIAAWWGWANGGIDAMFSTLWLVSVLAVMEVSLSFDNAVVNASVLKT